MKILIVEDNMNRVDYFLKKMFPNTLIICSTAKDAISILELQKDFDEIWLDHDLDGFNYQNDETCKSCLLCGCTVSRFIASNNIKNKVIIHSQNYYGSNSMKQILPNSIQYPFKEDMI